MDLEEKIARGVYAKMMARDPAANVPYDDIYDEAKAELVFLAQAALSVIREAGLALVEVGYLTDLVRLYAKDLPDYLEASREPSPSAKAT